MAGDPLTDPLDWGSFVEMKELDLLLRCTICYEFYNTAMSVPNCRHTYCTLCIRRHLAHSSSCPHTSCTERNVAASQLVKFRLIDEIVARYKLARPLILKALPSILGSEDGNNSTTPAPPPAKRRKTPEKPPAPQTGLPPQPIHAAPIPKFSVPTPQALPSSPDIVPESPPPTAPKPPPPATQPAPSTPAPALRPHPPPTTPQLGAAAPPMANGGQKAACPVCGLMVSVGTINAHLDRCLANPQPTHHQPPQHAVTPQPTVHQNHRPHPHTPAGHGHRMEAPVLRQSQEQRRPQPKVVYNLLKDKDLRAMLKKAGLSTQGSRQACVRRHQDYVVLWNAECDAVNPMSEEEIIKKVERDEKMRNQRNADGGEGRIQRDSPAAVIEQHHKEHLTKHASGYQQLIAMVRCNKQAQKKATPATPAASGHTAPRPPIGDPIEIDSTASEAEDDSDFEYSGKATDAGSQDRPSARTTRSNSTLSPARAGPLPNDARRSPRHQHSAKKPRLSTT